MCNVCYECEKAEAGVHVSQLDGTCSYYHVPCLQKLSATLDKYTLHVGDVVEWIDCDDKVIKGSILTICNELDGAGHYLRLRNAEGGVDEVPVGLLEEVIPKKEYKKIIACTNSEGDPDFAFVKVRCHEAGHDDGYDNDRAIEWAEENDYEQPFVVFDADDDVAGVIIRNHFTWENASVVEV